MAEGGDDVRRDRRRRRAGRFVRGDRARPRRAPVLLLERGPFPGSKNMYGGVVYPRILDDLHPAVVGGGAGPAMGHPPLDHGAHADAGPHRRLPHRRVGASRRTTAPRRYRPDFDALARRQGRGRRRHPAVRHHRHRPAPRSGRAGDRRAHRPARRRRVGAGGDRLRRRQQLPGQGGRAVRRRRRRPLHARRQGDARPAQGRHRRALRRARPRRRRHRDRRRHRRASTAARSSTPTSTRSPSGSCFKLPGSPLDQPAPRRSSRSSRPTRRSPRSSKAAR